jgi:chromosomal replication initiation ATPase DnaA
VRCELALRVTCRHFEVTPEEILAASRAEPLLLPRWTVMRLAVRHGDRSTRAVGKFLRMSHATVVNGLYRLQDRIDTQPKLASRVRAAEQEYEAELQ